VEEEGTPSETLVVVLTSALGVVTSMVTSTLLLAKMKLVDLFFYVFELEGVVI